MDSDKYLPVEKTGGNSNSDDGAAPLIDHIAKEMGQFVEALNKVVASVNGLDRRMEKMEERMKTMESKVTELNKAKNESS